MLSNNEVNIIAMVRMAVTFKRTLDSLSMMMAGQLTCPEEAEVWLTRPYEDEDLDYAALFFKSQDVDEEILQIVLDKVSG